MSDLGDWFWKNFTPGAAGIWLGLIGLFAWWIRGMPDRRRASNEGVTVESEATDTLIRSMQEQLKRMGERIGQLEDRVEELEDQKRGIATERDAALADNARLRAINMGQGQMRQDAAALLAAERESKGATA